MAGVARPTILYNKIVEELHRSDATPAEVGEVAMPAIQVVAIPVTPAVATGRVGKGRETADNSLVSLALWQMAPSLRSLDGG